MSLISTQTQVRTQTPALLLVFIVASFRVFEVTDELAPSQVAVVPLTTNANGQVIRRQSDRTAFVTSGGDLIPNNLYSLRVSPAFRPELLDTLSVGGGGFENIGAIAAASDGLLFVVSQGSNELYSIDAVDPTALNQLADFDTSNFDISQIGPSALAVDGDSLFLLNYDIPSPPTHNTILGLYDKSDPTNVLQLNTINFGLPADIDQSQRLGSVLLNGEGQLIAVWGTKLAIVQIDSFTTTFVDDLFTSAIHASYDPSTRLLYVLDNTGWPIGPPTIAAYDLSDLLNPRLIAQHQPGTIGFFNNQALRQSSTLYATGDGSSVTETKLLIYGISEISSSGFKLRSTSATGATNGGAAISIG